MTMLEEKIHNLYIRLNSRRMPVPVESLQYKRYWLVSKTLLITIALLCVADVLKYSF